ncbi:hypothetical protein [Paludibacter sp.]|uniref:hypothetical protein n=1 Tax=Paludibacter sp. TaxID=1898105 RepID=UPI00135533CD|nr:hypothetical protein [Paludibacter sp.]MTK52756.1 hypothetical protein [Paludibacter sp.]
MNNIFSAKRFALLVRKQWLENYLLLIGSFIVLVAFDFFVLYQNNDWDANRKPSYFHFNISAAYILSLGVCSVFILLTYFRIINTHTKQIAYYTQPTSTLEKLAAIFLFMVPVMLIAFGAALSISVPVMHSAYDSFYHTTTTLFAKDEAATMKDAILVFLTLQALILLGMHTFKRYAIVKTFIAIIILFFLFFYALPGVTFNWILPIEGFRNGSFDTISYMRNHEYGQMVYKGILYLPSYLVYVCWFALYFKMKEKQL